ncbi:MAG TPA: type II toxin-antitoxin system MqsA family antitoxin [Woeseiaceae bacterium]|nr:type II toxin-antitoxin system MqsA family antitoxin [Woeseiaceae bacterium]
MSNLRRAEIAKRSLFEEIKEGLDAIRENPHALRPHTLFPPDIKGFRRKLQLSQSEMATYLGVSKKTFQNWEQGVRNPTASAQTLLRILEKEPAAVMRALRA